MTERFYPTEENLGKNCMFWDLNGRFRGCNFPKIEMAGRTSCEGIVDDVCLQLQKTRPLTNPQLKDLKPEPPKLGQKPHIPPGQTGILS